MKDERLLGALIDKRAHIAGEIVGLEKQLSTLRAAIIHIDATLKLLDPEIKITEIRSKRPMFARSGYFAQGELSTRCQDAVRVAGVEGVSAEEVAIHLRSDQKSAICSGSVGLLAQKKTAPKGGRVGQ